MMWKKVIIRGVIASILVIAFSQLHMMVVRLSLSRALNQAPVMTDDGRYVVFTSRGGKRMPEQRAWFRAADHSSLNLYRYDREARILECYSPYNNNIARLLGLSEDGTIVYTIVYTEMMPMSPQVVYQYAFNDRRETWLSAEESAEIIKRADLHRAHTMTQDQRFQVGNGVYLEDRERGERRRVVTGEVPIISGDGNIIAYRQDGQIRRYDRRTEEDILISQSGINSEPMLISSDGRYVLFISMVPRQQPPFQAAA